MTKDINKKKYLYSLIITVIVFSTAMLLSNYFNQKKIEEIQTIQKQISTDLLSSEVQTSLMEQFSCKENSNTILSKELGSLGDKLAYTEENRGSTDKEVIDLKKSYSLLQIKDFILMNKINQNCKTKNVSILYFYNNACQEDCQKQEYVLTKLRSDFPQIHIYSFDYEIDLSAVRTLISINNIKPNFPAILIKDKVYYGFQSLDDMNKIIPELAEFKKQKQLEDQKQASSTQSNTQ